MISVIVPIYNVEKWLRQCIESVQRQSYTDLEIILIDDGSTDNSPTICDEYASSDSRIVVIHKANGGLSDARNAGIKIANGDYLFFLDSDDWLHKDAIKSLVEYSMNNGCDIVQCGHWYASEGSLTFKYRYLSDSASPFTLSKSEAMRQLIYNKYYKNFAWGKLYKKKVISDHLFPVGKFFEDSYWQHLIVNEADVVGVLPKPYYYYRQRSDSISGAVSHKNIDMILGLYERLIYINDFYSQLSSLAFHKFWKAVWFFEIGLRHSKNREISERLYEIKRTVNSDQRINKDWKRWFSYRYLSCSRFPSLMSFFYFIERTVGFFSFAFSRTDLAQYDSIDDISHILKWNNIPHNIKQDASGLISVTSSRNINLFELLYARPLKSGRNQNVKEYLVLLSGHKTTIRYYHSDIINE